MHPEEINLAAQVIVNKAISSIDPRIEGEDIFTRLEVRLRGNVASIIIGFHILSALRRHHTPTHCNKKF